MVQCPQCQISHVSNTIFCAECGSYLLEGEQISTEPLQADQVGLGKEYSLSEAIGSSDQLTIGLRIARPQLTPQRRNGAESQIRELEITLIKPIRLGRIDPKEGFFPEIDLTDLAQEHGISREHACIFRRGNQVEVEDLGSTNGTLLNGERLAPYIATPLNDGDRLQLGNLPIEVSLRTIEPIRTNNTPGMQQRFDPGGAS